MKTYRPPTHQSASSCADSSSFLYSVPVSFVILRLSRLSVLCQFVTVYTQNNQLRQPFTFPKQKKKSRQKFKLYSADPSPRISDPCIPNPKPFYNTTKMFATKALRQAAAHAERQPLIKFIGKRNIPGKQKFVTTAAVNSQPEASVQSRASESSRPKKSHRKHHEN